MATYCFRCPGCGRSRTSNNREFLQCGKCWLYDVRDYRTEGVGVAVAGLKLEREEGGQAALARYMLPHNDDFKSPEDPDGTKGMREWRENHQPKAGNSKPYWPGEVEKKVM